MDAPGLPSFEFVMVRRYRLHPYIRTFVAAELLFLMGFAGRVPFALSHSKCRGRSGLCQPRSNLSCHHCVIA